MICLQNHDQIGNRAFGDRLNPAIDLAAFRAASALLLTAPATPLLFMGQEWAATTPFLYFTDHEEDLGKLVTEGRRQEFRHFLAFVDPEARERIPDPQAVSTFEASRLDWSEPERAPHASILRLYQALLPSAAGNPHSARTDAMMLKPSRSTMPLCCCCAARVVTKRSYLSWPACTGRPRFAWRMDPRSAFRPGRAWKSS